MPHLMDWTTGLGLFLGDKMHFGMLFITVGGVLETFPGVDAGLRFKEYRIFPSSVHQMTTRRRGHSHPLDFATWDLGQISRTIFKVPLKPLTVPLHSTHAIN